MDDYLIRLPDSMSFAEGAAVYMNYATAWYALDRAGVRPGETVLVQGAAGGVGTAVLDLAPSFGAATIAVVSSEEKAQLARACGAGHVVRSDGRWLDEVKALTGGRGVEVFVDMVGGDRSSTPSGRSRSAGAG